MHSTVVVFPAPFPMIPKISGESRGRSVVQPALRGALASLAPARRPISDFEIRPRPEPHSYLSVALLSARRYYLWHQFWNPQPNRGAVCSRGL
jgi:hypothetical protein